MGVQAMAQPSVWWVRSRLTSRWRLTAAAGAESFGDELFLAIVGRTRAKAPLSDDRPLRRGRWQRAPRWRCGSPARVVQIPYDVEHHAVQDGVIVDGPGVCSASAKSLDVGLSRPSKILVCDRRERQQVDLVDLDHHGTAPVDTSDLDLWSRPQAVGDGDGSVRYSTAKIRAELHAAFCRSDVEPTLPGTPSRTSFTIGS